MSETRMIPLELIDPPLNPMRQDTLSEGLEELIADLRQNGQLQNVGVLDTRNGRFRLIFGSRRCAAFEEMSWAEIRATVFAEGEVDELATMAAENFQRTQLNPIEEAQFYRDFIAAKGLTVAEASRRTHRSMATIHDLLSLLDGDPDIAEALRGGLINKAQAKELNKFTDEIGRKQYLEWCKQGRLTAREVAGHREHRETTGISGAIDAVAPALLAQVSVDYRTQARCFIHNGYTDLTECIPRNICDNCMVAVSEGLELLLAKWKEEDAVQALDSAEKT